MSDTTRVNQGRRKMPRCSIPTCRLRVDAVGEKVAAEGEAVRKDLFVYLSGPMTAKHGYTIEENVAAGAKAFLQLLQLGVPTFCPHLSGAFPSAWSDVPYETWLDFDYAVIDRCTHVVLIDRWETSKGAQLEREYAHRIGKPVMTLDVFVRHVVQADPLSWPTQPAP